MKRRKIIMTGGLILILALGLCYLNEGGTDKKSGTGVWLCTEGMEGITSVSIKNNKDDEMLSFQQEERGWMGSDGSVYKNEQFAPYIAALGYMKAVEKVHVDDSEKQEYGLEQPDYTVSVAYDGGKKFHYSLGKAVDQLGMYITAEDGNIYLVDEQRGQVLCDMVGSLYEVLLTNVRFDEVRGINIFTPENGVLAINRSESPRADGDFYWNVFKPFAATADADKVNDFIELIGTIGSMERTDKLLKAEECGLTENEELQTRITFYDTYDSELTIYLGNSCGDKLYCKTNYLDDIYLIDKEIRQVAELTVDDILDQTLYYYEVASVEKCTVSWQGENYVLSARWVEANEEGERRQRFFLNDTSITGAKYNEIADWFKQIKVKREAGASRVIGDVAGTVSIERMSPPYSQTMTFRYLSEDGKLQVDWGGSVTAIVSEADVEKLLLLLRR